MVLHWPFLTSKRVNDFDWPFYVTPIKELHRSVEQHNCPATTMPLAVGIFSRWKLVTNKNRFTSGCSVYDQ